jgi:hypothetical protein
MKTETSAAARAIGGDDGSSIVLQTARARVEVVCMHSDDGPPRWTIRGDIPYHNGKPRHYGGPNTAAGAVAFALECLSAYRL